MTTNHTTATPEDTARHPEMAGDCDEGPDTRQCTPDVDEADAEEAGYGYGV